MRQRVNRIYAALLALLSLTACTQDKEEATGRIGFQSAPSYMAEDVALPVQTGDLTGCCTDGTYMYILASEEAGDEIRSVLCRVRLADSTVEELDGYQSSNAPENAAVSRSGPMLAPDGTLWLYEVWYVTHFDLPEDFDEETDLASFPGSPTGNGAGSCFVLQDQMGVSASSQAKEGAWAFVRSLLLPGGYLHADSLEGYSYTLASGFPINSSDFEALMAPRWCRVEGDGDIIPDKNGQPIEAPVNDMPIRIGNPTVLTAYQMAPTQAQMDRFWSLYNAIDHVSVDDNDLMQIVQEQAQPYFAGDKGLDETADLIQRRVTLYVNENR